MIQSATIAIAINRQSGDALIAGPLPPGITASPYNPLTGTLTLTGSATLAAYQTALHQVVFDTTSTSTADRIIQVTVNDGTSDSNVGTTYMHVVVPPPNVPPALDLDANDSTTTGANYLTVFTDGGPPVAVVDTDVSVVDNDSPTLASATVTLTNPQALDSLTFTGPAPGSIIVSGSGGSVITLTGAASADDYEAALQQIRFNTTAPSTETRIIDVVVNDGTAASNIAHAIIEVVEDNASAPTVDLDGDNSTLPGTSYRTTFTENGPPVAIADTDTLVGDPDIGSTTLASATITLTSPQIGDLLTATLPLPGGIIASAYDPVTGTLTLSNVASFTDYETSARLATLRLRGSASSKLSSTMA